MAAADGLVLVTGASGWLGRNLVQALIKGLPDHPDVARPWAGFKVRCLVPAGEDASFLTSLSPDVQVIRGDVRDPRACAVFCEGARGAVLLHVAGLIHPRRVREFYQVNVEGARNVLEAAAAAAVNRAVVMSSNSPCGCNPQPDYLFDESSPYNPYMNYGRSKMKMEILVNDLHRSGRLETVIIRAPWFYGPQQPPRQTLFFRMIREGKAPIVGSGENRRSMSYVDNLCLGLLLAARTPKAAGETYWIADRRPYTMNEVIDTVERLLEKEFKLPCAHKRMRLPGVASEVAYAVDKLIQAAGLYHQKIHVLSEMNKTIACSIAKAEKELEYRPAVELEEGMRRSIAWLIEGGVQI